MNNAINMHSICKSIEENIPYEKKDVCGKIKNYFFPKKKKKYLIKNCSINLSAGKSLAIIGSNGAGKSTLMKIISGIMQPSEGTIKILDYVPYERNKSFQKKLGVVFGHKSSLLWDLPAKYSFDLHKTIYGIDDINYERRLKHLTSILSMEKCLERKVKNMSLGERVKSDLIMNLLHSPELILLDEPTIGVDMESKMMIREFINYEKEKNNRTFILTSHDPTDIENCCDEINILAKGEIVLAEDTSNLKKRYQQKVKIILKNKELNQELIKENILSWSSQAEFYLINDCLNVITNKEDEINLINLFISMKITDFELKSMSFEEILAGQFQIFKNNESDNYESDGDN